ncbi:hypothetical protein, partial [Streptomyces sp. NPDC127098]|uniref:hypothetical protein n=1 Tax=Streptomyces sp. NPDC127098 TaxID=3347137 RepID=UPI00365A517E
MDVEPVQPRPLFDISDRARYIRQQDGRHGPGGVNTFDRIRCSVAKRCGAVADDEFGGEFGAA